MNDNGLIFRDVTGFIDCPDCGGRGTITEGLTPVLMTCGTCYGNRVIPLCGEVTVELPVALIAMMGSEVQS